MSASIEKERSLSPLSLFGGSIDDAMMCEESETAAPCISFDPVLADVSLDQSAVSREGGDGLETEPEDTHIRTSGIISQSTPPPPLPPLPPSQSPPPPPPPPAPSASSSYGAEGRSEDCVSMGGSSPLLLQEASREETMDSLERDMDNAGR